MKLKAFNHKNQKYPIPLLPYGIEIECFIDDGACHKECTCCNGVGFLKMDETMKSPMDAMCEECLQTGLVVSGGGNWHEKFGWKRVSEQTLIERDYNDDPIETKIVGREYVSPIIRPTMKGALNLINFCDELNSKSAKINNDCSLHVHIDTSFSKLSSDTKTSALERSFILIQEKIFKLVGKKSDYSKKMYPNQRGGKKSALNTLFIKDRKDVEFRLHKATLSSIDILNWTSLCSKFTKYILDNTTDPRSFDLDKIETKDKLIKYALSDLKKYGELNRDGFLSYKFKKNEYPSKEEREKGLREIIALGAPISIPRDVKQNSLIKLKSNDPNALYNWLKINTKRLKDYQIVTASSINISFAKHEKVKYKNIMDDMSFFLMHNKERTNKRINSVLEILKNHKIPFHKTKSGSVVIGNEIKLKDIEKNLFSEKLFKEYLKPLLPKQKGNEIC